MPELFALDSLSGGVLFAAALVLPMLVGLLGLCRRLVDAALAMSPVSALPGIALSLCAPVAFELPGFLLGSRFSTGCAVSVWLFLTSVLWFAAAWFGAYYLAHDKRRGLYVFFFQGSMLGNVGLVVASDPALFVAFFALMSFMSYGLVIHDRKPVSMRAGRVYLAMAVLGEVMQFAGLSLVAFPVVETGDPLLFMSFDMLPQASALSTVLFVGGFGVKAGILGLHMWLPMAHPVAPTPASAVLSGSMIKAGLIGWINLLPLGFARMSQVGTALVVLGIAGALAAALAGSVQKEAKAVLAYSSVSQMGLIVTVFGVGLLRPDAWDAMLWVVVVYAGHHAFAKATLFLSVGLKTTRPLGRPARMETWLFWGGTGLAALALAGAPATSGMVAKLVLKDVVAEAAPPNVDMVLSLLTAAAVGTTLLMARFADLLRKLRHDHRHTASPMVLAPWILLLALVCVFTWLLAGLRFSEAIAAGSNVAYWAKGLWPVASGVAIYWCGKKALRLLPKAWSIPPGDIHILFSSGLSFVFSRLVLPVFQKKANGAAAAGEGGVWFRLEAEKIAQSASLAENRLAAWTPGAAVLVVAGALFFWLALR